MTEAQLLIGLMSYVVFLFSTTCHEAAHAWAAHRLEDDTAYMLGHVTLDPTPHIKREPIGMVAVPLISLLLGGWMIGWASVPYNPNWAQRWPKRCALMAMAGPAANFSILLVAVLLMKIGVAAGVFEVAFQLSSMSIVTEAAPGAWSFPAQMLSLFFSMNLLLGVFNLLPCPPLDGASIAYLVLPPSTSRSLMLMNTAGFGLLGLLIAWKLFGYIYPPIWASVTRLFFGG